MLLRPKRRPCQFPIRAWRRKNNAVEWQSSLGQKFYERELPHAPRPLDCVLCRLKSAWSRSLQGRRDASVRRTPPAQPADLSADRSHRGERYACRRGVAASRRRVSSTIARRRPHKRRPNRDIVASGVQPRPSCEACRSSGAGERSSLMDLLLWIVFGLVVGLVAKLIMPGNDPGGIILTIVLGIVGAMLGGWLGRVLGLYREGEAAGFIMAVVGAVIILGIYRLVLPGRPGRLRASRGGLIGRSTPRGFRGAPRVSRGASARQGAG